MDHIIIPTHLMTTESNNFSSNTATFFYKELVLELKFSNYNQCCGIFSIGMEFSQTSRE